MPNALADALDEFVTEREFKGQGSLCVALVVTKHARERGMPLDSGTLVTAGGGQVLGLGKSAVQAVLKRHGIERVLAAEGGRTSRGSLHNMKEYVVFLNDLHRRCMADIDAIENYWIDRVRAFFAGKPFTVKLDSSRGLRHVVRDILDQAINRQKQARRINFAGAVSQHLVGAKLDCVLDDHTIEHNGFSTADAPRNRVGDFLVGDVAVHVTTAPGEAVIERCRENLDSGLKPVLVTLRNGAVVAEGLANNKGLAHRIDIFEIEQFVALNLYELGGFDTQGRQIVIRDMVNKYNEIIEDVETDPSLKIEIRK